MLKTTMYALVPVLWSAYAYACLCDDSKKRAEPFEEAYKKASVIFIGEVEEMVWKGPSTSKTFVREDGMKIDVDHYIDPAAPDRPFDPKAASSAAGYRAILNVKTVWKDDAHRIISDKITVRSFNGGWCGFQFEKGQRYLVYARDGGDKNIIPVVSVCSRTRPYEYGTDDVQELDKLQKK